MALQIKGTIFHSFPAAAISIFILGERRTSHQFILHTESTWNKTADWTLAAQSESECLPTVKMAKAGHTSPSPMVANKDTETCN